MTGTTSFDPLGIRKTLGRQEWYPPMPHGMDGWRFQRRDDGAIIIASCAPWPCAPGASALDHRTDIDMVHASMSLHHPERVPEYADLKELHRVIFGDGYAYQVFAPPCDHVNIRHNVLHLFGRLDGAMMLPDFTAGTGSL